MGANRSVLGRGRDPGVVLWQEDLLEEAVGLDHVGDAGEPEFLGQALLQGADMRSERPLASGE